MFTLLSLPSCLSLESNCIHAVSIDDLPSLHPNPHSHHPTHKRLSLVMIEEAALVSFKSLGKKIQAWSDDVALWAQNLCLIRNKYTFYSLFEVLKGRWSIIEDSSLSSCSFSLLILQLPILPFIMVWWKRKPSMARGHQHKIHGCRIFPHITHTPKYNSQERKNICANNPQK